MLFAAASYLLALSMEENIRSCGPAHVLNNTPLVPLLENIVVLNDHVQSFSLCVVFGGEGTYIPLVRCALLRFCASIDYLPMVFICEI